MSLSTRKSSFSSRLTLVLQSLKSTATLVFCLCGQSLDSILQLNQLPSSHQDVCYFSKKPPCILELLAKICILSFYLGFSRLVEAF